MKMWLTPQQNIPLHFFQLNDGFLFYKYWCETRLLVKESLQNITVYSNEKQDIQVTSKEKVKFKGAINY